MQFGHLAKECSEKDTSVEKVQHREERSSNHIGCPNLYEGQQEEEDAEEEVMTAMCHSDETYSIMQCIIEDEDCYKQLNQ